MTKSGFFGANPNFATFGTSVYSLLVLQTTSNFPDVMMASFDSNHASAFFFFVYNLLGIYFLMALVLAVIYNTYNENVLKTVYKITVTRRQCVRAAVSTFSFFVFVCLFFFVFAKIKQNDKNKCVLYIFENAWVIISLKC